MEKKLTVKSNFYEQEDVINVNTEEVDELINEEIEAGNVNASLKLYKHKISLQNTDSPPASLVLGTFLSTSKEPILTQYYANITSEQLGKLLNHKDLLIFEKATVLPIINVVFEYTASGQRVVVYRINTETSEITTWVYTKAKEEVSAL